MTLNQILSVIYPILLMVLTGLLTYLGKEVVKLIPIAIEFIATKIGFTKYAQAKAFGWDIWNKGEEALRLNPIIGDTVQAKIILFETAIRKKIPDITDAEIEDLRQAIAGEFNKDKPLALDEVKTAEAAVINTITVAPIDKYVAPDGTELVKLVPTQIDPLVAQAATV